MMIARRHLALLTGGALLPAPSLLRAAEIERPEFLVEGFSRARLERFVPAMAREVERGSFNGAVALIARNGRIVHHQAYGHLDNARTRPMHTEAVFLLASMTKPLTSVAALMLMEEGRLKLSDPITQWLPELRELKVEVRTGERHEDVPLARPITVQDLLRHTAGFVYAGSSPSPRIRELYQRHDIEARNGPISGEDMLRHLGTIPLAFQPGTMFFYSISTDVLGLLLERVSGQRLDRLIEERITGPLGMRDTVWWLDPARRPRLAESIASDPLTAPMWRAYRIEQNEAGRSYLKGGAGMIGTSMDYFRFAQMIANGGLFEGRRYLSAPVVNFMLSNHMVGMGGTPAASTGPGYGFGLGFGVRLADGMGVAPGSQGDAMWAGAWGTSFTIDRAERLVGVFMAQGPSSRVHTRMVFKNLVYGAMVTSAREG
jgi:CubicO group peptidase (beta-lactamase class C family)